MKILCISTIDWNFLWQRHQIFMKQFAEAGWEVYFIENTGFRNPGWRDFSRVIQIFKKIFNKGNSLGSHVNPIPENVHLLSPIVLPPNGFLFRWLNKNFFVPFLMKRLEKQGVSSPELTFLYLPSSTSLEILKNLNTKKLVFDYVSNFSQHPDKPQDFEGIEGQILAKTDMVLTDSDYLCEYLNKKHKQVNQLHHGADIQLFTRETSEIQNGNLDYKSVCFFGAIDNRIDWKPLKALTDEGINVTLIGTKKVDVPKYIHYKSALSPLRLAEEIQNYDAFIIPYTITDFSKGIVPAKLFECMATGKPILISPIPSVEKYSDIVYVCCSSSDYVNAFENLKNTETIEKRLQRRKIAQSQSLEENFRRLQYLIHELLEDKQ